MSGRGATCDCELLFAEWAATTGSTSPSMLDHHHYWKELSRLVDAFRRAGKLGGKASLTTSTENGLWKASLEIQTNPSSAAQPGPASTPTPPSAAPNQDGAAGRRRPRRRRGPASALRSQARARAHQATLAARRQGTCQTPATRVQAAPPPRGLYYFQNSSFP